MSPPSFGGGARGSEAETTARRSKTPLGPGRDRPAGSLGLRPSPRRFHLRVSDRRVRSPTLTRAIACYEAALLERLIGSMRRKCVDHVVVLNERSLQRILRSYVDYYHHWRTHLTLGRDPPVSRAARQVVIDSPLNVQLARV